MPTIAKASERENDDEPEWEYSLTMATPANRIPVIIGVGQLNDRPVRPVEGLDSVGLMCAALKLAETDAGVPIFHRLDWLGVEDQISFPEPDCHLRLAREMQTPPTRVVKTAEASGDGPLQLINDAANLIAAGEIQIAAATGGEAMRTANKLAEEAQPRGGSKVNKLDSAAEASVLPLARRYGLTNPANIYPLYEQGARQAWGQTFAQAQAETAAIWSGLSKVAAANPHAWLRKIVSPEEVSTVSADNRLVSFPYTKLMVANMSVNQGAAVIITSLAIAQELGIADPRLIYVLRGAAAQEADDFLGRENYQHSAALAATITQALKFNELSADQLDYVEFYSCFPCIPKMARRVLGWPLERPHSVYGGLTFGGGPVGNCMMHAAAAMVEKLREASSSANGLIMANGGYATHNHSLIFSRRRPASYVPQSYDVQTTADEKRGLIPPIVEDYTGPAHIETYSVPFDRQGKPSFATIIGRTPAGARVIAHVSPDNSNVLQRLVSTEIEAVGARGTVHALADGRRSWAMR
jgi:acetyl-CoA C-acetyltransferase